jgi:two-component system, cell cycle sensor histidine kinase and response regulator CckA
LEEQLRHSQKLQAIGQLAGGVAHDFNNLLTIILGNSDLLLKLEKPNDLMQESVVAIQDASERAAVLIQQLLLFGSKAILEPKIIDLNIILQNMSKLLRRLISEDIAFTTVLGPALHSVKVDPCQLEQVIMNLSLNARDAMPCGGKLILETSNVTLGEDYCALHPDVMPGDYVLATMTDTGCGMTPEVKARIFEPFFTTKGVGRGTGLGLATVYGIVKQSGGHIEVYSEVSRGTMFKLYFPTAEEQDPIPGRDSSPAPIRHGSETVLLVEDNDGVRSLAQVALRDHGYKVLIASDGKEALRVASEHTRASNLLVTDVVMPVMSGRELADAMRACDPNLKVLYISGYTDDAVVQHGILHAEVAILQKPFTPRVLAEKVGEILAGR